MYATCVGLGFAGLENIFYVVSNIESLVSIAVVRGLFSVPGHFFFAVYMGIYLGEAKADEHEGEGYLLDRHLTGSLLVPTLLHGFWDFSLSTGSRVMAAVFYVFVLLFFLLASVQLRAAAERDTRI